MHPLQKLIILCIFTTLSYSNELKWEQQFDAALQKAADQNKTLMMLYSAPWCPECEYMKDVVLPKEEISAHLQEHYVPLVLNIQKDDLPKGFNYEGIPTFFFIDKNGKEIGRIIGGDKAEKFLKRLKEIQ